MVGQKFGRLTALTWAGRVQVQCECGVIKEVERHALLKGHHTTCGCRIRVSEEARFWAKVDKRGPDECWEWTGSRDDKGYGRFGVRVHYGSRGAQASRVAWRLTYGDPGEACVLHRCDNPPCVNPAHLFLGTIADNIRDMDQKGRRRTLAMPGSTNANAKLTEEIALAIRREYRRGEGLRLAQRFGISSATVYRVVRMQSWRHISDESDAPESGPIGEGSGD